METKILTVPLCLCAIAVSISCTSTTSSIRKVFVSEVLEDALDEFLYEIKHTPDLDHSECETFVVITDMFEHEHPVLLMETNSLGELSYPIADDDIIIGGRCVYDGVVLHVYYSKKYDSLFDNPFRIRANLWLHNFSTNKRSWKHAKKQERQIYIIYNIEENGSISLYQKRDTSSPYQR